MRCEEKIANGKLVSVEVWPEGGNVHRIKITGDFFLHPEEAIEKIEQVLTGISLDSDEIELTKKINDTLQKSKAELIGVSAEDIARVFKKAVDAG